MNGFTLGEQTLALLASQLRANGCFQHTCRSACSRQRILFHLTVEHGPASTGASIELGSQRHSLTLPHSEPCPVQRLADFIEAIANGRLDSAEPAPACLRAMPLPEQPAPPRLNSHQQQQLRHLVRAGGFLTLWPDPARPVRVAIHRNHPRPGLTGILASGEATPHTLLLASDEHGEEGLYTRVVAAVEQLALTARPTAGAA